MNDGVLVSFPANSLEKGMKPSVLTQRWLTQTDECDSNTIIKSKGLIYKQWYQSMTVLPLFKYFFSQSKLYFNSFLGMSLIFSNSFFSFLFL